MVIACSWFCSYRLEKRVKELHDFTDWKQKMDDIDDALTEREKALKECEKNAKKTTPQELRAQLKDLSVRTFADFCHMSFSI